jgi:hypothetical protein
MMPSEQISFRQHFLEDRAMTRWHIQSHLLETPIAIGPFASERRIALLHPQSHGISTWHAT